MSKPNTKLSKLQKFILTEAFKERSKSEENAQKLKSIMHSLGKPGSRGEVSPEFPHVSRIHILIAFDGLKKRKWRWHGHEQDNMETNRIDREAAGSKVFNRANAGFYNSVRRLEERGLLKRGTKGGWQLTPEGESASRKLLEAEKKETPALAVAGSQWSTNS